MWTRDWVLIEMICASFWYSDCIQIYMQFLSNHSSGRNQCKGSWKQNPDHWPPVQSEAQQRRSRGVLQFLTQLLWGQFHWCSRCSKTAGFDAKIRAPAKLGNWAYVKTRIDPVYVLKNRLKTTNTTYDFNMIQFPDFCLAGLAQSSAFSHDASVRASFQVLSVIFFVPRNFSSNAQPSTSGLRYFALLPISQSPRLRHCFWSWRICVHGWWQGLVRHYTSISCHFLCHGLASWKLTSSPSLLGAFWIHGR